MPPPPPLSQTYMGAYIDNPNNSSIFEGLQASLSLVGIALFFLQVRAGRGRPASVRRGVAWV